jgi:hypothetical protein
MRSQLLELKNYMTLPLPEGLEQTFPSEALASEINNDIQRDLLSHRRLVECDTVADGDVVTVLLAGPTPKYCKKALPLNVGKGLFDAALEPALVGRHVGESFTAPSAAGDVKVTVLQCRRTEVPTLDNGFVCSLGLECISTVAQYQEHLKNYYRKFYHDGYVEFFAQELMAEALNQSCWQWDEAEMAELNQRWHALQAEIRERHDTVLSPDPAEAAATLELEEEELRMYVQMLLVDCLISGRDSAAAEPDLGLQAMSELRERILAPVQNYLSGKVHITFEEELQ